MDKTKISAVCSPFKFQKDAFIHINGHFLCPDQMAASFIRRRQNGNEIGIGFKMLQFNFSQFRRMP